jgi:hypothetical protein
MCCSLLRLLAGAWRRRSDEDWTRELTLLLLLLMRGGGGGGGGGTQRGARRGQSKPLFTSMRYRPGHGGESRAQDAVDCTNVFFSSFHFKICVVRFFDFWFLKFLSFVSSS